MADCIIEESGFYCRTSSSCRNELATSLENCYSNAAKALVFSSGMQAIYFALDSVCEKLKYKNLNVIYGSELYCDTPNLIKFFCKKYCKNYSIQVIDVTNSEQIIANFPQGNNILFLESCSNPSGYIFDFQIITQLRRISPSLYIIIDNTWLTHVLFNPFIYDVDIVVTSLTKYYSAGNAMGGVVLFKDTFLYKNAFHTLKMQGVHIDRFNIENILANLQNIEINIRKGSLLTVRIIDFLTSNNILVFHPYVSGKEFKSVLLFKLENFSKSKLRFLLEDSKILPYETSFGSSHSKIDRWPIVLENHLLVRLSVGFNDTYEHLSSCLAEIIFCR